VSIVEEAAKIIDPVAFTDVAWANGSIELDQDDLEMVRRRYCRSIAMNKATQVCGWPRMMDRPTATTERCSCGA